ncbi:MAG: PLxRFG domain-containing protein [Comamonas sp.]
MAMINTINEATFAALLKGVKQFQAYLTGTDEEHAAHLLELMKPQQGAVVVDAGCGIGETARLMHGLRPDLRFVLVNLSASQLAMCPPNMEQHQADYCAMPLPDASADVVMFHFAACHCDDWTAMLQECRRVLKAGGTVFLHEPADAGADRALWRAIGSHIKTVDEMARAARLAGFAVESAYLLEQKVSQFHALVPAEQANAIVAGMELCVLRLRMLSDPIEQAFNRHERIGLQFSGGRDSTATLYLLRDYWPRMVIYHLDTGDQFPETKQVVKDVQRDLDEAGCSLTVVRSDVFAVRREHGLPSDLVPVDNHNFVGRQVSGAAQPIQSRYECCARTLMAPLHDRIRADGITLLIRGQRDSEYATPPVRSGGEVDGIEFLYPIQEWTEDDVMAFNLIPGTGLLQEKSSHTRDYMELLGPAGDFVSRVTEGGKQILGGAVTGDAAKAFGGAMQIAPTAIRNAAKGIDMGSSGQYKDARGGKVSDVTPAEAIMKAIGFQPNSVAEIQEANYLRQQAKNFYNLKAQEIRAMWAKGIAEKDQDTIARARAALQDWNAKNPDQPMTANLPAIIKKAKELQKDKADRIAATAPKAMRMQMKREIQEAKGALL